MVEQDNDTYYRNIIKDMNEEQAIKFVSDKVKEAIIDTWQTRKRLDDFLDRLQNKNS